MSRFLFPAGRLAERIARCGRRLAHLCLGPLGRREHALWTAVNRLDVDRVRGLLEVGHNPNLRFRKRPVLIHAVRRHGPESLPLVEALLEAGADANAVDRDGCTALSYCFVRFQNGRRQPKGLALPAPSTHTWDLTDVLASYPRWPEREPSLGARWLALQSEAAPARNGDAREMAYFPDVMVRLVLAGARARVPVGYDAGAPVTAHFGVSLTLQEQALPFVFLALLEEARFWGVALHVENGNAGGGNTETQAQAHQFGEALARVSRQMSVGEIDTLTADGFAPLIGLAMGAQVELLAEWLERGAATHFCTRSALPFLTRSNAAQDDRLFSARAYFEAVVRTDSELPEAMKEIARAGLEALARNEARLLSLAIDATAAAAPECAPIPRTRVRL